MSESIIVWITELNLVGRSPSSAIASNSGHRTYSPGKPHPYHPRSPEAGVASISARPLSPLVLSLCTLELIFKAVAFLTCSVPQRQTCQLLAGSSAWLYWEMAGPSVSGAIRGSKSEGAPSRGLGLQALPLESTVGVMGFIYHIFSAVMSIRSQAPQSWNQLLMDWQLQNGFRKTPFYHGIGKVYLSGLSWVFAGMVILSTQVGSCYPQSILHTNIDRRIPMLQHSLEGKPHFINAFLWQLKLDYPQTGKSMSWYRKQMDWQRSQEATSLQVWSRNDWSPLCTGWRGNVHM